MIRLIVNADDLGSGSGRDRGILRAFREGLVTSASLLANGPSFHEAAKSARASGLPVGVHLNLSEGRSLSGPISGLTDKSGRLPGKEGLRQVLTERSPSPKQMRRELAAQVERVLQTGLRPDHLDSHQHFALFPQMTPLLIETACAFGIDALRLPLPVEPAGNDPEGELAEDLALYRRMAPGAAETIRASGLAAPEGLWGMPCLDRLEKGSLGHLLEHLPEGTWELMTHPGEIDPGHPFSGAARTAELEALIDPDLQKIVRLRNIRLATFRDLTCAS